MPKTGLAVPDALYMKPLLQGLSEPSSPFNLVVDIPAQNAISLTQRAGNVRCAFLSPVDYARHGGQYRVVPGVCVSSERPSNVVLLYVNSEVSNINSIAVDVRVTSEIILAKIILVERYRSLSVQKRDLQFIPMVPDLDAMLKKADAALIVNLSPTQRKSEKFVLDLIEEWKDFTDLPYVHGFWVARQEDLQETHIRHLVEARDRGMMLIDRISHDVATQNSMSPEAAKEYFSHFSYELGEKERESISEFFRYAYYHGVVGDVPDINYFEDDRTPPAAFN